MYIKLREVQIFSCLFSGVEIGILSDMVGMGSSGIAITLEDIEKATTWIPLTQQQLKDVRRMTVGINLGITAGGLNTNTVSEENRLRLAMRSYPHSHPACWEMYLNQGGLAYRMSCSRREINAMIEEYENEQEFLTLLIKSGFKTVWKNGGEDHRLDFLYKKISLKVEQPPVSEVASVFTNWDAVVDNCEVQVDELAAPSSSDELVERRGVLGLGDALSAVCDKESQNMTKDSSTSADRECADLTKRTELEYIADAVATAALADANTPKTWYRRSPTRTEDGVGVVGSEEP